MERTAVLAVEALILTGLMLWLYPFLAKRILEFFIINQPGETFTLKFNEYFCINSTLLSAKLIFPANNNLLFVKGNAMRALFEQVNPTTRELVVPPEMVGKDVIAVPNTNDGSNEPVEIGFVTNTVWVCLTPGSMEVKVPSEMEKFQLVRVPLIFMPLLSLTSARTIILGLPLLLSTVCFWIAFMLFYVVNSYIF